MPNYELLLEEFSKQAKLDALNGKQYALREQIHKFESYIGTYNKEDVNNTRENILFIINKIKVLKKVLEDNAIICPICKEEAKQISEGVETDWYRCKQGHETGITREETPIDKSN